MGKPNDLRVYMLNAGRPVFYAEPLEDVDDSAQDENNGVLGRAEAFYRKVRDRWEHSQGLAAQWGRRTWATLQDRAHPDERLLARLRSARSVEVNYPPSAIREEVRAAWSKFLAGARRRHWAWLVGNALVCPLTIFLAPLPGPNLIGYWFVYRAAHHWLILSGLGRVRRGVVETRFAPEAGLASLSLPGRLDAEEVARFLSRHGVGADEGPCRRDSGGSKEPATSEAS